MRSNRYISLFRSSKHLNQLRQNYINVKKQAIKKVIKYLLLFFKIFSSLNLRFLIKLILVFASNNI